MHLSETFPRYTNMFDYNISFVITDNFAAYYN